MRLPAAQKLGDLLYMRPALAALALCSALEVMLKDTARQLLWRQLDRMTARPAPDFNTCDAM